MLHDRTFSTCTCREEADAYPNMSKQLAWKNLQSTDGMLQARCEQHVAMHSQTPTHCHVSNSCFSQTSIRSIKAAFLKAGETHTEAPDNVYT